ncbi:sigma 54 modulation/S30EA ribosomal C-terminal domain-containing protein [Kribbella sp. NBC_01510]|uniref:sigma 54 modulation/S30EA ribosomal C-terminal domain-containing protein n=1 Tax=Kribbella sp. NBC_01510 TaxID=2903581 RepID=UPI00386C9A9B
MQDRVTTSPPPSPPELLPPSARRLARQKTAQLTAMKVAEAISTLEAMDQRFHLFQERYSRQDSVVIRTGPGVTRSFSRHRTRSVSTSRPRPLPWLRPIG